MVIMALLLECWQTKAHTLRGCTGCVARGLSFQEREFQEPKEVTERGTVAARAITALALALLPIATADPCSWGRKLALPEERNPHFCGQAVQNLCFVWVQDIGG